MREGLTSGVDQGGGPDLKSLRTSALKYFYWCVVVYDIVFLLFKTA